MAHDVMRIWQRVDTAEVGKHLLNVGESLGNCESCKELGLDYSNVKQCPACKTEFKYVTAKNATGTGDGRFHVVKRLLAKRHDLIFVDYDDFKKNLGRDQVKKFFSD